MGQPVRQASALASEGSVYDPKGERKKDKIAITKRSWPASCSTLTLSTQRTTTMNNRFRVSHLVYNSWQPEAASLWRSLFIFYYFFILLLLSNSDAASGGDEASSPDFYSLCHLHCNLWFVYRFIAGHALVLLLPLLLLLLALQLFKQNIDINVFAYILFFLFYWAEPGGIGHWSGWLTIILQCCATVGWVIWPVKSSQKWPIMTLLYSH